MPLLSVRNLTVKLGHGRPVDGVTFDIAEGETFTLLGESGCGKSMTALALMGLLPSGAGIEHGAIELEGRELTQLDEPGLRRLRGGAMGTIFQEPATSLNPVRLLVIRLANRSPCIAVCVVRQRKSALSNYSTPWVYPIRRDVTTNIRFRCRAA
jgi:peptide/nickel transport system ATP-binding protein